MRLFEYIVFQRLQYGVKRRNFAKGPEQAIVLELLQAKNICAQLFFYFYKSSQQMPSKCAQKVVVSIPTIHVSFCIF